MSDDNVFFIGSKGKSRKDSLGQVALAVTRLQFLIGDPTYKMGDYEKYIPFLTKAFNKGETEVQAVSLVLSMLTLSEAAVRAQKLDELAKALNVFADDLGDAIDKVVTSVLGEDRCPDWLEAEVIAAIWSAIPVAIARGATKIDTPD